MEITTLKSLYEKYSIKDGIKHVKDILIVKPDITYDIKQDLLKMKLSKHEVCVTWPRENFPILNEIALIGAKHIIQVGKPISRKFWSLDVNGVPDLSKRADAFVSLHHHDEYSLRDGLGKMEDLITLLKAQKRNYCAVTNHGSLGGWVKQYIQCKDAGIKPIFGAEMYWSPNRDPDPEKRKEFSGANHLLMLAINNEGFYNLIKIHNDAQLNGFYRTPRTNDEAIINWGSGICSSSTCFAGEIPSLLWKWDSTGDIQFYNKAIERYEFYKTHLSKFYIELPFVEFPYQVKMNKMLVKLGKEVNGQFIITSDSHYLLPEHSETHDLLMLMRGGKTVADAKENPEEVWQFSVKNLYYRNAEQMNELWDNGFVTTSGEKFDFKEVIPEDVYRSGIENTHDIACMAEDIELDSSIKLPKINIDSAEILRHKAFEGLEKFGFNNDEKYVKRLEHELAVITKMGWPDYFLIVQDFIKYANDNFGEFAVGPGRGSACGSLVSYCIGITHIDPLEYGLLFERFLDESRTDSPPDIDIDFDPRCRDIVKKYIVDKYGENKTCSIGTYQSYRTKAVILDVARTLNLPLDEVMAVTKSIDSLAKFDIDEGDESHSVSVDDMDFDHLMQLHPELCKYLTKYPEVLAHAKVLRNQVKNMSTHAGGVIISENDLNGKIPVIRDKEDRIVSAWAESGDVAELSKVGLVKFDILGVAALTTISDCIKLIEQNRGIKLTRKDIPLSDSKSIRISSKGDLLGIFQLENPGTKPIADDVGLDSIDDISALTSLIRPGPKDMGMHLLYAKRKRGQDIDDSTPKQFNELLKDTHAIVIYQEQAMLIARELAGFTPAETNKLRKGIGKKILSVIMELKEKFIKGVAKTGKISVEDGEKVWHILESFAGYGFNKCVTMDTVVEMPNGFALISDLKVGDEVRNDKNEFIEVLDIIDTGDKEVFEITTENGSSIKCTIDHKFLCEDGVVRPLWDILFLGIKIMEAQ